jgi:serine/threonine protein kinase
MIPRLPRGFSHPMLIGEGGFSSVFRVRQVALDRWVALKVIHEQNPAKRDELLKEAKIQGGIKAACIPQIYDAFEYHHQVFIVMEWIKGVSLSSLLEKNTDGVYFSDEQKILIADEFIRALAQLHSLGYAHRDLKPANVIITPENGVYLVDFGLSKPISDGKTLSGAIKGTPAYMAPELWLAGTEVNYLCTDVYAAGRILQQLLPGLIADQIVPQLLIESPILRVHDGRMLLDQWSKIFSGKQMDMYYEDTVAHLTGTILSDNLFRASRELLYTEREKEAYWLLVECIESNSEHAEAVNLMNDFPGFLRKAKRRNARKLSSFAGIVTTVVMIVLYFGYGRHENLLPFSAGMNSGFNVKSLKVALSKDNLKWTVEPATMHQGAPRTPTLNGSIELVSFPNAGSLYVDNIIYSDTIQKKCIISLSFGMHVLIWKNSDKTILWKEHVEVLPFQRKRILISYRGTNG